MKPRKKKEEFSFTYVALGLVVGIFVGASLLYWFSARQTGGGMANNLWVYLQNIVSGSDTTSSKYAAYQEQQEVETVDSTILENRPRITRLVLSDLPAEHLEDTLIVQNLNLPADSMGNLQGGPGGLDQPASYRPGDTSENLAGSPANQMQFAQDKLLQIRAYNVGNWNRGIAQTEAQRKLDSLLGNYHKAESSRQVLIVEFWESPLKLTGYKMTRSKLILYGLAELTSFSLHTDGNSLIIKYSETFFPVNPTNVFTPLRAIEYPEILEEFQQRWP